MTEEETVNYWGRQKPFNEDLTVMGGTEKGFHYRAADGTTSVLSIYLGLGDLLSHLCFFHSQAKMGC